MDELISRQEAIDKWNALDNKDGMMGKKNCEGRCGNVNENDTISRQEAILKPCPFCGSKASLNEKREIGTWIVECTNGMCTASYMMGWDYDTPTEAIEAWNRRVYE